MWFANQKLTKDAGGFTLLEMLLVTSIILTLAVTLSGTLLQGSRVFKKIMNVRIYDETGFLIEKLTRDLKNSFDHSLISYAGEKSRLSFSRVITGSAKSDNLFDGIPVRVTYFLDRVQNQVKRVQSPFFGLDDGQKPQTQILASNIKNLKFNVDQEDDALPFTVTVEITYGGQSQKQVLRKDISIPKYYVRF